MLNWIHKLFFLNLVYKIIMYFFLNMSNTLITWANLAYEPITINLVK